MKRYGAKQVKNKSKTLNQQNNILCFNIHPINTLRAKKVCLLHKSAHVCKGVCLCVYIYITRDDIPPSALRSQ